MTTDEMKALRDFPAEVVPPDEETRQRVYAFATGEANRSVRQHLGILRLRKTPTNMPRFVAVLAGAVICAAVGALAATGAFSSGSAQPLRHPGGGGGLEAPPNPVSLAFNHDAAGTVSSITVTASPNIPSASAELEVFLTPASTTPGVAAGQSTMVYQEQIPLTAPSAEQQPTWSGVLSPSDWTGGCQAGRYTVDVITAAPGTSLSTVVSETPAQLSNDPNKEVDGVSFNCQG